MTVLTLKTWFSHYTTLITCIRSTVNKISLLAIIFLLLSFIASNEVYGQKTWTGATNNNWNVGTNWAPTGVPTAGDAVTITSGATVNVNVAAVCASIAINGGSNSNISVNIQTGQSLTVSGAIQINASTGSSSHTLSVGEGSLSCGSLTMETTGNQNRDLILTISTGTVTISGNLTMEGAADRNEVTISGAGMLNIGGTFNNNGAFTPGSGTVNYNGSGAQAVRDAAYNNLTFSGGGEKTLSGAASVSGVLTLTNGNLVTATGVLLTLSDGATVSGGSKDSFIDGPLAKTGSDDFTFPVGDAGIYAEVGISDLSGPSTFTAEYFRAIPTDPLDFVGTIDHISGVEYWDVSGGTSASVTLSWRASSGVTDLTSLVVAHYVGTTWQDRGQASTSGNAAAGTITSNSVTTFSPFTLASTAADASNPLPVELLSFTAKKETKGVLLEWETATEVNNAFFQIERSLDGKVFDAISKVEGVGNSDITQSYQMMDKNPRTGINYYRLKQVDFDGDFEYHPIVSVDMAPIKEASLQLFPNPAIDKVNVFLPSSVEGPADIAIYNAMGQLVKTTTIDLAKGSNTTDIDIQELAMGRYTLIVNYAGQRLTQAPLVIQK